MQNDLEAVSLNVHRCNTHTHSFIIDAVGSHIEDLYNFGIWYFDRLPSEVWLRFGFGLAHVRPEAIVGYLMGKFLDSLPP